MTLPKISFNKSKKNLSSNTEPSSKVVQIKILVKIKTPPTTKGVVIRKPPSQPEKANIVEVERKGKGKSEDPLPRSKSLPFSPPSYQPSSSKSSLGNKRSTGDNSDEPYGNKTKFSSSMSPPLSELFASRRKRLRDSWLTPLPGFVERASNFVFQFFNHAWENWSKNMTIRQRG
ncbi:Uncharacterized protein Adt_39445 [Abeliophyllum distichum]|uniref:Uncharacterized protein n=1 Tax=Abeliophyllum distichum TaxID=126358 RepID=A0ABD1Q853_9LAMI